MLVLIRIFVSVCRAGLAYLYTTLSCTLVSFFPTSVPSMFLPLAVECFQRLYCCLNACIRVLLYPIFHPLNFSFHSFLYKCIYLSQRPNISETDKYKNMPYFGGLYAAGLGIALAAVAGTGSVIYYIKRKLRLERKRAQDAILPER